MSKYDELKAMLGRLWRIRFVCTAIPVYAAVTASVCWASWPYSWFAGASIVAVAVLGGPWFLHWVLPIVSRRYARVSEEMTALDSRVTQLRRAVEEIYGEFPVRPKGKQFKIAYRLNGRHVRDFERAMAVGMRYERKEVFVTAFVRCGTVVRVTASIGSPLRCAAADDPNRWPEHYRRLKCDEIRQYHNHPEYDNRTAPSPQDFKGCAQLEAILHPAGIKLASFIVFWNKIYEWRLLRYDGSRNTELEYAFDAAA